MKRNLFLSILAATATVMIGLMCGCDDGTDCGSAEREMLNCQFYRTNPNNDEVERDTLKTLTITALGTDSIILNNVARAMKATLPLSYTSDTTVFVFHYDYEKTPAWADTLTVVHENVPYFKSLECGYTMKQKVVKILHTKEEMQSTHIVKPQANNNGKENVQIYYRYRY